MPRLSGCRSGWPPSSLPAAPLGAQSDPLPTDPGGIAPPPRRGEPAAGDRHPRRGRRGRFLSACIRRAAPALRPGCAAIRDAAAAGARPAGPSGRPPREPSAARPSRGGALRALGVAVLASAVLLTGLLGAGGAFAQTTNADGSLTLWEATLEAGTETTSGSVGYYNDTTGSDDFGTLSNATFQYEGTTNTVDQLRSNSSIFLFSIFSGGSDLSGITNLTLHVGSEKFAFADGSGSGTVAHTWNPPLIPSWSSGDTVTVKLVQSKVPSAPRNLRAKGISTTEITLLWTQPSKNGGSAIKGYKIEESTDSGITWTDLVADTGSTTTAYQLTGLTSGHTRLYRVSAFNDIGTGPVSNEDSGTAEDTVPALRLATIDDGTNAQIYLLRFDEQFNSAFKPAESAFTVKVERNLSTTLRQ